MSRLYIEKKSATADTSCGDMHPADVIAALRKAGMSLRQLSLANGYCGTTLKKALVDQYPIAERLIADVIGVHPMTIWPSRYNPDGTSTRKPTRQGLHRKGVRAGSNSTSAPTGRHVNVGTVG